MRRRGKMMGAGIFGAATLLFAAFFAGCGSVELPEGFEEQTVQEEARKSVEIFNERDYHALLEMGSEEMKASITAEQFAQACDPYLDKCGEFKEISKTAILGGTDRETGIDYAAAVMVGEYENGKIQFTVGFDEDMKLIQFLIK